MIDFRFHFVSEWNRLLAAGDKASFKNMGHAAARIRLDAIKSIEVGPLLPGQRRKKRRPGGKRGRRKHKPAPPGHAPFTDRRQLNRAIVYDATEESAVIGPRESIVGTSAMAHEFGGSYRGGRYPERPFMNPALQGNLDRFLTSFGGSIGS